MGPCLPRLLVILAGSSLVNLMPCSLVSSRSQRRRVAPLPGENALWPPPARVPTGCGSGLGMNLKNLIWLVSPCFALFGSDSPSARAKGPDSYQPGARPPSNCQVVVAEFYSLQVGLIWFISLYLDRFPRNRSPPTLDLRPANPPRSGTHPAAPKRCCGGTQNPDARLASPARPALPGGH